MKKSILKIKETHKEIANEIRYLKSLRKQDKVNERPENLKEEWSLAFKIWLTSKKYRLRHIAYCLNRGREYSEIESQVYPHNELHPSDWSEIKKIQEEYRKLYEEDVCANEQTA